MSILGCNRFKNNPIKKGFTIIEVSLFLAITGLIFVGMIVGIQTSLTQNHYDDDVRSLADFLQNAYSKVISVENNKNGDSDKAIYGKLITFGEKYNLAGESNADNNDVFIYDVIGDLEKDSFSGSAISELTNLNAKVLIKNGSDYKYAGIADSYRSRWGTKIEGTEDNSTAIKAALLIVRSPANGNIFTYASVNKTIEVNQSLYGSGGATKNENVLKNALTGNYFANAGAELNLCINMEHRVYGGKRKNIRIDQLSRGSTGVNIVHLDDAENKCKKD